MSDEPFEGLGESSSSLMDENSVAVSLFSELDLFQGLDADEVREIVHAAQQRQVEAGDVLFEQGDEAQAMYLIEQGELEVRARGEMGQEVVLAVLGAGTVVGEMAILVGSSPRSATVEALSDVQAFYLSQEAFNALRDKKRPVAYKLIMNLAHILGERRRQTDKRVNEVFDDPATHVEAFEAQVHDLLGNFRKA